MSGEMKYTQGPWQYMPATEIGKPFAIYSEARGFREYVCVLQNAHYDESLNEPNARLIAAAPDLLAIAQKLLDSGDWFNGALEFNSHDGGELAVELEAAIAKATGAQT